MRSFCSLVLAILFSRASISMAQDQLTVDTERTKRFVETLQDLGKNRDVIRKQCSAIESRDQLLAEQMRSYWLSAVSKHRTAFYTPQYGAMPILGGIAASNQGLGRRLSIADPQTNGVWYRLQDNSMAINMLNFSALNDQLSAQNSLQSILSNRVGLLDIANQADRNFALVRAQADWMGRRSRMEHEEAIKIAREAQMADPRNAGMALVEATAHRSLGDFKAADDLLDEMDDYFFQLQVIHALLRAQCDFINNNVERSNKTMAEIGPIAKERRWVEPLLLRGWMAIASGEFDAAKRWAYEAKEIAPEYLEVSVLSAWVTFEDSPKKAKDAIRILRDAGIRSSSDDWYYFEAMANGFARIGDWKQAQSQMEYALETAPSHVRSNLQAQLVGIEQTQVSRIEWAKRLRSHWKLDK